MTTIDRPPHLIDALHDLDTDLTESPELAEPAPERRQPGHLIELYVTGEEPYTVRVVNRDRIAYEQARAKRPREWPVADEARNFAMTFYTWNAARRAGRTTATFTQWQELLEDFDIVTEQPADPTQ